MIAVSCIINADGTFKIENAPLGAMRVSVETEGMKIGNPKRYVKIPAKYADSFTSDLEIDVRLDGSPIEITIQ